MLSFVPRGHRLSGWQKPRVLTRVTYFYIDPDGPLLDPALRFAETEFKPRLFFHDAGAVGDRLEAQGAGREPRAGAAAIRGGAQHPAGARAVAAQRRRRDRPDHEPDYVRGGLAAWQKARVTDYVEEHLADNVLLSQLAEVARLSPFHFSRAFKQSFGLPPLRYVTSRRIERAKTLLAGEGSITQVGLAVGFGETSSFTTAFRRHTGVTPTVFRRGLD